MFINADLIESVEPTPDTVITMVDNRRLVVSESPEVIVARVQEFRASLLVAADTLRSGGPVPQLTVVPDLPDDLADRDEAPGGQRATRADDASTPSVDTGTADRDFAAEPGTTDSRSQEVPGATSPRQTDGR